MKSNKRIGALVLASALTALMAQSPAVHACTSNPQTTHGFDSFCQDSNTSGRSRGVFSPRRVQAFLFQGKRARAVGLKADGDFGCSVFDLRADGENPTTSTSCTTTVIAHQVIVTPNT